MMPAPPVSAKLAQAPLPHSVLSSVAMLPAVTVMPTVWLTRMVLVRAAVW